MMTLIEHVNKVITGERRFENAAQAVTRMIIFEKPFKKIVHAGETIYDFDFFREGKKHIVGWFKEINEFVNFVKDAAEGGSAREMAFVLVGEPGNGKTFFVEYICTKYREFLSQPANRRYTFEFINLDQIGGYGNIKVIQSQTFEDPMILLMNLIPDKDKNKEYISKLLKLKDKDIESWYKNYRPLGACTEYIWNDIRKHCDGNLEKMLEFVRVVPVPMAESLGTVTGKYSAKDKITSSSADLIGEESLQRILNLSDVNNPYRFDLRRGALARVAGGGIHFSDEIFKNKKDLVQIYLQVIQNRNIEIDGFKWPIDTLIIATSNNWEYNRFVSEKEESPIKDRCRICYVAHNTDYKLQHQLTSYALGLGNEKKNLSGEGMHIDPNLIYATSVAVVLTRLPDSDKLTPIETMKLEAGEIVGEKGIQTLLEVKEKLDASADVTRRWGQKGLSHRDLGRALQILISMPTSHEGKCLFAKDIFKALEKVIYDYVPEAADRDKYLKDLKIGRQLYREKIKMEIYNAYRDDPEAIKKDVMAYVNMIIGIDSQDLGPDKMWRYRDPQTGELKAIKIDEKFIEAVENRLGLTSKENKESFRTSIRKIYGQKINVDPNYDFMDNEALVRAITEVRLESDVTGAGSLIGALSNLTNEENKKIYNRMIKTMLDKLGYCPTCAKKTIEYFCTKEDE